MFLSRNKKDNVYPYKSQFYYIKVGFKGVKIIYVCFRDVISHERGLSYPEFWSLGLFRLFSLLLCTVIAAAFVYCSVQKRCADAVARLCGIGDGVPWGPCGRDIGMIGCVCVK